MYIYLFITNTTKISLNPHCGRQAGEIEHHHLVGFLLCLCLTLGML